MKNTSFQFSLWAVLAVLHACSPSPQQQGQEAQPALLASHAAVADTKPVSDPLPDVKVTAQAQESSGKLNRKDLTGVWGGDGGDEDKGFYTSIDARHQKIVVYYCADGKSWYAKDAQWDADTLMVVWDKFFGDDTDTSRYWLASRTTMTCEADDCIFHRKSFRPGNIDLCAFWSNGKSNEGKRRY